jgi:hypothetical protein
MAPVPWSVTVTGIAKQGLEVHHPLIGSVRHEQKMMEVKIVQKKYGFTKFFIEKCNVSIRFFVCYSIIYRSKLHNLLLLLLLLSHADLHLQNGLLPVSSAF